MFRSRAIPVAVGPVDPRRLVLGILAPLGIALLSYVLWWIGDRLLYVGPLDRAALGWSVVIPAWVAGPIVGGLLWRDLPGRTAVGVAAVVGAVVSSATAVQLWRAATEPICDYGPVQQPIAWVLPSLAIGMIVGGGVALSGLVTRQVARRGRVWLAIVAGALTEVAMVFVAIIGPWLLLAGPACNRPPI